MISDPIADFLTRIRNAHMARRSTVIMPHSTLKEAIAKVMLKNNFLQAIENGIDTRGFKTLICTLIPNKTLELKRISKPGQRIYIGSDQIRKVKNGYGIAILSTPKGVITGYEAKSLGVGGEYLCTIS